MLWVLKRTDRYENIQIFTLKFLVYLNLKFTHLHKLIKAFILKIQMVLLSL